MDFETAAKLSGETPSAGLEAAAPRETIPGWFFAAMLELFSSQGTSIGCVALLILYSRRRASA